MEKDTEKYLSLSPEERLRKQWEQVVLSHIDDEKRALAEMFFQETVEAYSEETRKYHNLEHILFCLEQLEAYRDREDFLQLWLTILWHDVVYDTHSAQNEEQSAYAAGQYMEALNLPGVETVQRLIVSTRDHRPETEDEQLICSIDMLVLASDPEVYQNYSEAIRAEYSWVPEEIYRQERIKVLKKLKEPFEHPDFRPLNTQANQNLESEISRLAAYN